MSFNKREVGHCFRLVISFIFLLSSSFIQIRCQPIIGLQMHCDVDGAPIYIPLIMDDPCISCFCKSGFVLCRRERCPEVPCHVIVKEAHQCCPECQKCRHGNRSLSASLAWLPHAPPTCVAANCNNEILTYSHVQCKAICSNPQAPPDDECCPACSGCVVGGVTHFEDDVFPFPGDRCTECTCKNGNTICLKTPCPVLACRKRRTRLREDGCCLECVGHELKSVRDDNNCWFRRRIIPHGRRIKADKCTKCICQKGTMECERRSCPIVNECPESELVYKRNHCCPICPKKMLRRCSRKDGETYKHGETWTELDNSCQKCRCNNGTVTCTQVRCPVPTVCKQDEILDLVPGKCCKSCVPAPGICTVFGDPHYRTYDGRPFNFQGDCQYILSKECNGRNFTVVVQNDGKRSRSFSWTKTVFLHLHQSVGIPEIVISLHQRLTVKVDGHKVFLPIRTSQYDIQNNRGYVDVKTTSGVSLRWDGDSYLEVGASPLYQGMLCGLCGNFNGFPRDDYLGEDGSFKWSDTSFAESWKSSDNIFDCTRPNYDATMKRPCNSVSALAEAREKCSIFKDLTFRPCYATINPVEYYESCLMDTCECPRNRRCSCESLRAYTQACSREGFEITWNEKEHCRRTCKRGKVYTTCGPPCRMTCRNFENTKRNKRCLRRPCSAGCHCPAGHVIYRKRCVKASTCPSRKQSLTRTHRHRRDDT